MSPDWCMKNGVDVLALAESDYRPSDLLLELNRGEAGGFRYPPTGCSHIQVFVRFSSEFLKPVRETTRYTIRRLSLPEKEDILLATVHMKSKLHRSDGSEACRFGPFAEDLRSAEDSIGHRRSVLLGDLNANPFEPGLVAASQLHGVMSRQVAAQGCRRVDSREYEFLYNPMCSLLGDCSPGPPGTYYYRRGEEVRYFWNMFDQVMVRPALIL